MVKVHWIRQLILSLCVLALCWSCVPSARADGMLVQPEEAAGMNESLQAEDASNEEEPPEAEDTPNEEDPPLEGTSEEEKSPESGNAPGETDPPTVPPVESYTVTLGDQCIGADEVCSYTTLSPEYAGDELIEGYYPGALTVEITGQVVVEAGGTLAIGTLSIGGPEEHPLLTGSGQIVVKAGGILRLTSTSLEGTTERPMIVQEPGGSVVFQDVEAEEGLVQWSSLPVNNLNTRPDDIWLEVGTVLTEEMLPDGMEVAVQDHGTETWQTLSLAWDLSAYDGRTDGEVTLVGSFLGDDGQPLLSIAPLELTVHWYTPETLAITEAVWKGETVPTVQLTVSNLPEFAEIWGEVSTDGGETWTRWEDPDVFFIVTAEEDGNVCVFQLPDETPRWFRIAAHDPFEHLYWRSDSFYLSREDQDDSGGNRGGSVTPSTPDREPAAPDGDGMPEMKTSLDAELSGISATEPTADKPETVTPPEVSVEDSPVTPLQTSAETAGSEFQEPAPVPEAETRPNTAAQSDAADETDLSPSDVPEVSESSQETATQPTTAELADSAAMPAEQAAQKGSVIPVPLQVLLVAAGIAVSVTAAMAAARVGPFKKKT